MITVEKPGSPEELVHFGKKGMRWGIHNSITKSSAFKNWSKLSKKNVDSHHARVSARNKKKAAKPDKQTSRRVRAGQAAVGSLLIAYGTYGLVKTLR